MGTGWFVSSGTAAIFLLFDIVISHSFQCAGKAGAHACDEFESDARTLQDVRIAIVRKSPGRFRDPDDASERKRAGCQDRKIAPDRLLAFGVVKNEVER